MNDTDKLIQDQFNSLPPAVKESISSVPWRERVRDIAKREGLDADKSEALETETLLILYGFQIADDYTQNIVGQVGLDEEAAERITKEVSDEILSDIEKQFEMIDAISRKDQVVAPKITQVPTTPRSSVAVNPMSTQAPSASSALEVAPNILPETLPGQIAHNVARLESMPIAKPANQTTKSSGARPNLEFPQSGYAKGKDPYREPLE